MKTLFALAATLFLFAAQASAQSDSVQVRSAFGANIQASLYRWNSRTELTENNSRVSLDGGMQYIRFLGKNWYLQSGVESARRRNIRPVNNVESHVVEEFMQIPLMVGYGTQTATTDKFNRRVNVAAGVYGAQLLRQGIAPLTETRIKLEKRENDYWKFGFHLEASVMLMPKSKETRVMHQIGFRSFMDIRDAYIQNDKSTPVFTNYTGGSLFYTLYFPSFRD